MTARRKREITGLSNERDFPHLVELALPPKGLRAISLDIDTFHRHNRIPARRGRSQHDIGQPRIRFCFPDAAIADAFRDRFRWCAHDLRTRKVQVPHFDARDRGSQKDQGK
jgi:hypothetical protein